MSINFGQLRAAAENSFTDPRQIFSSLPNKSAKYSYLRDVQADVLDEWLARKDAKDLRIKMNTGGGKTVVGLLILQSCLNDRKGPAVYIAPTAYLAKQVIKEASALGLATDTDPRSYAVMRGSAILVTHIEVLLNGQSKFGVGDQGVLIRVGSLLLDDAHACLASAEKQFTLNLNQDSLPYKTLLALFRTDLESQNQAKFLELSHGDPSKLMQVPFWAWQARIGDVRKSLLDAQDLKPVQFVLPLLNEDLHLCRCVIGARGLEITPHCLPIRQIPSFVEANRRVFMSATFADDSIVVTHFNVDPGTISAAIAPKSASDLGDRMILVPQELNPEVTDEEIREQATSWAEKYNVVVIVPSNRRAEFWKEYADRVLLAATLEAGVEQLRTAPASLTVIVNKYDGIDFPDSACRVLILDGLPDVRRMIDRIDEGSVKGTTLFLGRSIQQVEQGMGRGVRSNTDYCAVLLMGRTLIGNLFIDGGLDQLTPATRAQFALSEQIGDQVRGKPFREIVSTFEYCLSRNQEWVGIARSALANATYITESVDLTIPVGRRKAWDDASSNAVGSSIATLQSLVDAEPSERAKGWLLAETAEYENLRNQEQAQNILKAAVTRNRLLALRPKAGLDYVRINPAMTDQASSCLRFVRATYSDANRVKLAAHAVAEDLVYRPDSYRQFERALSTAASFLGFQGQLAEEEFGRGPDVLWALGHLRYYVIECKSEATVDTISKQYCNQLAGSMNWFASEYDQSCRAEPILCHPARYFEFAASLPPDSRVMTEAALGRFRAAFLGFCTALSGELASGSEQTVAPLLHTYKMLPDLILPAYSEMPLRKK